MLRHRIGLTFLLMALALSGANDALTKESLQTGGRQHGYFLFVPASASAGSPMLVLLHGSGHDGRSLIDP